MSLGSPKSFSATGEERSVVSVRMRIQILELQSRLSILFDGIHVFKVVWYRSKSKYLDRTTALYHTEVKLLHSESITISGSRSSYTFPLCLA